MTFFSLEKIRNASTIVSGHVARKTCQMARICVKHTCTTTAPKGVAISILRRIPLEVYKNPKNALKCQMARICVNCTAHPLHLGAHLCQMSVLRNIACQVARICVKCARDLLHHSLHRCRLLSGILVLSVPPKGGNTLSIFPEGRYTCSASAHLVQFPGLIL